MSSRSDLRAPLRTLHVRVTSRELVPADGPLLVAGNYSAWLDGRLAVIEAPRPVPDGACLPRRATVGVVFGASFTVELPENRRSRHALSGLSEQIRVRPVDHPVTARPTRRDLDARAVRAGDLSADVRVAS